MTKLLGANWRTTLWGGITVAATAITTNPLAITFLPDSIEGYVRGLAGVIALIAGGVFVANVKDKQVTGGVVQQTADGAVASRASQAESSSVIETQQAAPKP